MELDNDILHRGWDLLLLEENTVEDGFNKKGLGGCQEGDEDHADHGSPQLEPVGFDQIEEPAIIGHPSPKLSATCKMEIENETTTLKPLLCLLLHFTIYSFQFATGILCFSFADHRSDDASGSLGCSGFSQALANLCHRLCHSFAKG